MSQSTMSVHAVRSRASLWTVLLSSLFLLLSACGGGASNKSNSPSSKTSSIASTSSSAEASSQIVQTSSSNAAGQTSSDANSSLPATAVILSGRVAVGAALANARVIARCSDGSGFAVPVVTDINGGYQGTIPDSASLPCALQARGGEPEVVLHSYASAPGTVNITTLTDLIISSASGQLPLAWFDSNNWQSVAAALDSTQSELAHQLSASGYTLNINTFAPFTTNFVIGDAHDKIMDRLQEAIDANGDLTSYEDLIARIHSGNGLTEIPPVPSTRVTATSVGLLVNNGIPTLRVTGTVSGTYNSDTFLRIRTGSTVINATNSSLTEGQFSADVNLTQLTQAGTWYDVLVGITSINSLTDLSDSLANMGQTITVNNHVYSFKEWGGQLKVNFDDTTASSSSSSTSSAKTSVTATSAILLVNNGIPTLRVTGTVSGANSDTFLRIRTGTTVINVANSAITTGQFSADVNLTQLTQAGTWYDVLVGITSINSLTDLSNSLANMGQTITVNNRVYSFKEWGGQLKVNFDNATTSSSSSAAPSSSSSISSAATSVTATSVALLVNNGIPTLRVTGTVSGTNSATFLCIRTGGSCISNVTNSSTTAGQFSADVDLHTLTNDIWYDLLVGVTGVSLTDLTQAMANMAQTITVNGRLYEFKEYNGDLKINIKDVSITANATAVTLEEVNGVPTLRVNGTITGTSNDDVYLSIRTNGETYNIPNNQTTAGLFSADFDPAVLTKAGTWYDIVLGITSKNTTASIPDARADMNQTLSKDGRTYEFKQWDHLLKINFSMVLPGENQSIRIEFGLNDTANGNQTTSPDTNGVYWNNVLANVAAGAEITAPVTLSGLKTTDNLVTAAKVTINTSTTAANRWLSNGRNTGGLLTPNPTYLNNYAIDTATEDFFFVQSNGTATLTLSGLDPNRLYNLKFFGTRAANDARRTTYTVTGATPEQSVELQTTGTGVGADSYNGNNNTLVSITDAQPTTTGELTITVHGTTGQFGYLGFLEITGGVYKAAAPSEVARWVAQDMADPLAANSVLFVGSSSIRRWETLTEDFRDYNIIQRGWGGSWFTGVNDYSPWVVWPYQPSAIVMWAGTNDLNGNQTAQQVLNEYRTFVSNMKTQSPNSHFFWISITPNTGNANLNSVRMETNALIKQEIDNDTSGKLHYIDVATHFEDVRDNNPALFTDYYVDSLHLSRLGYAYWANAVRTALAGAVPANKTATTNPATLASGEELFFDFGPSNTSEGDPTSTDSNGHHWNNWVATNGGGLVNVGEHIANLVDSTGRHTGIGMTIAAGFQANGKTTGGLLAPDLALLGDLAVATATQDFFFSSADGKWNGSDDDLPGGLMLTGLNPSLTYTFHLFGSRAATDARITEYSVRGHNTGVAQLQTSGTGISHDGTKNGNDSQIAVITGIQPDAFGQVWIDLTVIQGSYAYLNAMKIVAE